MSEKRVSSFEPYPEQQRFLEYTGKQALLYGGFGGGKTVTGCEKVYLMNMRYPGNRALIVRKNFSDVKSSTIQQTLLEDVIPDSHIPEDGHNKTEHRIRHFTGTRDRFGKPVMSEIYYEGLDQSGSRSNDALPRRISGMQFGTIFIDEATETTESDYVQLLGRLRYDGKTQGGQKFTVPFRQIFAATNPAGPSHYLYQRFFDSPNGETETFHLKAEDNPGVPDDYVEDMKSNYSGVYYERYVEGKWVGTEDVIYDEFDRRSYVRNTDELLRLGWEKADIGRSSNTHIRPPSDWDIFRTIDFGYPSPSVCQWWARSPENDAGDQLYVMFREFYHSETHVDDLADWLHKFSDDIEVDLTYADPANADNRETLKRRDIRTQSAEKDVWNGIQEVKSQMGVEYQPDEQQEAFGDDPLPGIVFYEDALVHKPDRDLDDANKPFRTVDEFGSYEWKSQSDDRPKKKDDHGMDAMRYLIYSEEGDTGPTYDEIKQMAESLTDGF